MRKSLFPLFLVMLCMIGSLSVMGEVPKKPEPARFMNDGAGVLNASEVLILENELRAYSDTTQSQVVVVLIKNLDGRDIADEAFEIGRSWGIGRKGLDSGVLMLWSLHDRKMFIATGYGHEGNLPDVICKRIVEETVAPHFKTNHFFNGIQAGIHEIFRRIAMTPEQRAEEEARREAEASSDLLFFVLLLLGLGLVAMILVIAWLTTRKSRGGRYYSSSSSYYDSSPSTFSFSGGSDSSSSSDFGGGDFGGGGGGGDC